MTPESHGDDYHYHLLLLYYPWREETQDLLGDYGTAQEALLAKRDQLYFLNSEHSAFVEEIQQAIQQLSVMRNTLEVERAMFKLPSLMILIFSKTKNDKY